MVQFAVVMGIIGTVTSYFFGTDTAVKVGLKVMDWWILAGLAVVVLTPIFNILSFVISVILKIICLFHRKKPTMLSQPIFYR